MKAIVLAGGEATRLRPLTARTPKTMVPVLNRPYLEHLVAYLKRHDIVDIVLAVGRLPDQVEDHFGDGSRFGVRMAYSTEESSLGTAGAVKNAEEFIDGSFFVLNGDIFTEIDLGEMEQAHRRSGAVASIALTPVDNPSMYGVVETDSRGGVLRFTEKPGRDRISSNMVNAGVYILEPEIMSHIAPNTFSMFERDVFPLMLKSGHATYGHIVHDYWIDIGTPGEYLRLQHDLLRRHTGREAILLEGQTSVHSSSRIEGPVMIGRACRIGRNAFIKGPAVLGDRCLVEDNAVIEGAVLWSDCTVHGGARLNSCLVASGCQIGEQSEVPQGCILGDDVVIEPGITLPIGARVCSGKSVEFDTNRP